MGHVSPLANSVVGDCDGLSGLGDSHGLRGSLIGSTGESIPWFEQTAGVAQRFHGCHPQEMTREKLVCAILGSVLGCCVSARAQEAGAWRASSQTAMSITGDIAISDEKLFLNFYGFPMARIRDLEPGEVSAAFDVDSNAGGRGRLYRLSIPGSKKFLHKNSLCGSEDTQWMAAFVEGRSLHIAFFSGPKMPVFTPEAFANSTDLCGTFTYAR
jgi:hypothetical protein